MENSSCAERKSYLPERFLFASSPVLLATLGYMAAASADTFLYTLVRLVV
jgi:hypothetical protein